MASRGVLLLATGNPGKVREMRRALRGVGVRLLDLSDLPSPPPEEPEETADGFLGNAGIKALAYHRATGLPALAEDSGLEVDALGGGPGVRSARWLGRDTSYQVKNRRLIELVDAWGRGRGARYRSATAIAAGGRIVFRSTGAVEGEIARAPRGTGGFGYDPVFFLPERGRTMAELSPGAKEAISHRGRALEPVCRFLRAYRMPERRTPVLPERRTRPSLPGPHRENWRRTPVRPSQDRRTRPALPGPHRENWRRTPVRPSQERRTRSSLPGPHRENWRRTPVRQGAPR